MRSLSTPRPQTLGITFLMQKLRTTSVYGLQLHQAGPMSSVELPWLCTDKAKCLQSSGCHWSPPRSCQIQSKYLHEGCCPMVLKHRGSPGPDFRPLPVCHMCFAHSY